MIILATVATTAVVSVISDGDETESEENPGSVAGSDVDTASGEAV